jgi:hypothetical protein
VAVTARGVQLARVPDPEPLPVTRAALAASLDTERGQAKWRAVPYCFAADAEVLLSVGPDGQPGVAGEDDDFDGRVDDVSETGAVGSDDRCLAPYQAGYERSRQAAVTRVISRGSFVRCQPDRPADRFFLAELGWFIAGED